MGSHKSVTLILTSIFNVIWRSSCVFWIGIPIYDLGFRNTEKFYARIWYLNDLKAEYLAYFKVYFKFLIRNSHSWPRAPKDQVNLAMALKSILSPRSMSFKG